MTMGPAVLCPRPPHADPPKAGLPDTGSPLPSLPQPAPTLSLRGERPASGRSLPLGEPRRPGGLRAGPPGPAPGQMFPAASPAPASPAPSCSAREAEAWALLRWLPPRCRAGFPNGKVGSPAWSWGCRGVPWTPALTWPPPAARSWPPGLSGAQPRAGPRPRRGGEQALLGACQPAQPGGGGRKQDEGESQPSKPPAQAAHHAGRPPLSGRVACPPPASPPFSANTHGRETGPGTRGASWHPVRLAAGHCARAAGQQALPLALPPPPAGLHAPSSRRGSRHHVARRGARLWQADRQRAEGRGTPAGRRSRGGAAPWTAERREVVRGKLRHRPGRRRWLHGPQDTHTHTRQLPSGRTRQVGGGGHSPLLPLPGLGLGLLRTRPSFGGRLLFSVLCPPALPTEPLALAGTKRRVKPQQVQAVSVRGRGGTDRPQGQPEREKCPRGALALTPFPFRLALPQRNLWSTQGRVDAAEAGAEAGGPHPRQVAAPGARSSSHDAEAAVGSGEVSGGRPLRALFAGCLPPAFPAAPPGGRTGTPPWAPGQVALPTNRPPR